jgi:hypothetical protein
MRDAVIPHSPRARDRCAVFASWDAVHTAWALPASSFGSGPTAKRTCSSRLAASTLMFVRLGRLAASRFAFQ